MESLSRWREPAAVVAVVGLGLGVLFEGLAWLLKWSVAAAAGAFPLLIVVLAVLAALCRAGTPSPHARHLAVASLAVASVGTLTWALAATLVAAAVDQGFWLLAARLALGLIPSALAVSLLVVLVRAGPGSAAGRPAAPGGSETHPPAPGSDPRSGPAPAPVPPEAEGDIARDRQPTWQRDEAAGYVWRRAGDAAAGAPAAGSGREDVPPAAWGPDDPARSGPTGNE